MKLPKITAAVVAVTVLASGVGSQPVAPVEMTAPRPMTFAESKLRRAIAFGEEGIVEELVAAGVRLRSAGEEDSSVLSTVTAGGDPDYARRMLMRLNALPPTREEWNEALHRAVLTKDTGMVRWILELRPEREDGDLLGHAALAALFGREAVLRVLLEAGVDPLAEAGGEEEEWEERKWLLHLARLSLWDTTSRPGGSWRPLLPAYAAAAARGEEAAVEMGITPLMGWAYEGDLARVAQAVDADAAEALAVDVDGWTALHWAAAGRGDAEIIGRLLKAGVAVDDESESGDTALEIAAATGNVAGAKSLLAAGANPLPPGFDRGVCPLLIAARLGHVDVVRELMHETGAEHVGMPRILRSAAAFEAALYEHWPVVLVLIEAGIDPDFKGGIVRDMSILSAVAGAKSGGGEVVEVLFAAGASEPVEGDFKSWWPMERAIQRGNVDVFRRLVERLVVLGERAVYASGVRMIDEALIQAGSYRRLDFMRVLVEAGADVNAVGIHDSLPLSAAAGALNADAVRFLLEKGADATLEPPAALLPLTAAAAMGCSETIALLVAAGADVETPDRNGYTPLQTAASHGNVDAIRALMAAGAKSEPNQFRPRPIVWMGWDKPWAAEVIRALVEGGADINAVHAQGLTALDVAESRGRADLVEVLLELGARRGAELRQ